MNAKEKNVKEKIEKTMHYSTLDGVVWAIMMNTGTVFLTPFAIAIKAPLFFITALGSFPALFDGIAQKIGSFFTDFGWERKKILIYGVALQALTWFGVAMLAFQFNLLSKDFANTAFILLVIAIYFFGGVVNPAWFAIIGDVVHEKTRASWLGYRDRMWNLAGLAALVLAGIFLDYTKTNIFFGFGTLFFIAFVTRSISAYYLTLYWDPNPKAESKSKLGNDFTKYLVCIFLVFFSVNMVAPYIIIYKFNMLKFDYFQFSLTIALWTISYALASPHWGRLIEKYGTKKVLNAVSMLSFTMILPWIFVSNFVQSLLAEAYSGIIWSGISATVYNYLYEITPVRSRVSAMGDFSLSRGTGTFAGIIFGGAILGFLGGNAVLSFHIFFLIIALTRLITGFFVVSNTKEIVRPLKKATTGRLIAKIVTIYPFQGLAHDFGNFILWMKKHDKKHGKSKKSKI
ncbi:MAG: MFS transporter [Candidatus Micrarchaeota archaeon]